MLRIIKTETSKWAGKITCMFKSKKGKKNDHFW